MNQIINYLSDNLSCKFAFEMQKYIIMPVRYIERSIEPVLKRAGKEFPAVVLVGPRQSGKTTLLKHLFSEGCGYITLEPPGVRAGKSWERHPDV